MRRDSGMTGSRPRLLIVNPNTNVQVTEWLREEGARASAEDSDVVGVNAASGLAAIQTPDDIRKAAQAVVDAIIAARGAAAAIVGAFGDPGLAHARTLSSIPVIGLGEAGMREAGKGGRRFSIVTLGAAMRDSIAGRAESLGLEGQLVDILILSCSIADLVENRASHRNEILAAIRACKGEAVLLGGAPFAGLGAEMSREIGAVILDGVAASVAAARKALSGHHDGP
jgi:allantoin racemase